jgi:hypothetical protein
MNNNFLDISLNRHGLITRRRLLQLSGAGFAGLSGVGILQSLGLSADQIKRQGKACIMCFLSGAPSQLETWDPKPGTENGGPTKAIDTKIAGVQFAEYWPKLAAMTDSTVSVIRSMSGKEAAHERGRYHLRTGRRMVGSEQHPHFGSVVAHKLGDPESDIPNFVSIGNTISSGFLGVQVAPFVIDRPGELPANVSSNLAEARRKQRMALLGQQDADFAAAGATALVAEHQELYAKAAKMMTSKRLGAFKLDGEDDKTKAAYGSHAFGQSCLVARRLVEAGVPFIEVQRGGWDMHSNLWQNMPRAAGEVDQGVSQLLTDLKQRGMLEKTLVIVLGEFGRTPKINQQTPQVGRDHWARNFNVLIAGCGISGGVCVGATSEDGMEITDRPVFVDDLFQTMSECLGIDPYEELYTPAGRPLRIVDNGTTIEELV